MAMQLTTIVALSPSVDLQSEGLFSLWLMLECPNYVTAYVQVHWRKQYVDHLLIKEETTLLARYQPFETADLQRPVMLGQQFGIGPAHLHIEFTAGPGCRHRDRP
jgi:hypothetical protein